MPLPDEAVQELQRRGLSVPGGAKPDTAGAWAEIRKRGLNVEKPAETEKPGIGAAIWEGIKRAGTDVVEGMKRGGEGQLQGPETMGMLSDPVMQKGISERLGQQEQQSAQAYQQNPARMAHPLAAGAGRVGGNVAAAAPLAAVPGGGSGMALGGRAALGAAMGGATGGPVGMAAGGAVGGLGGMLGPALSPAFQAIAQKYPNLARMAIGAEGRTPEAFRRSTANEVLQPLGESLPRSVKDGHDLVNAVGDKIDDAYNTVLPKVKFHPTEPDPETGETFNTGLKNIAQDVPAAHGEDFGRLIERQIDKRLDKQTGAMSGADFKKADHEIGRKAARFLSSPDGNQQEYGEALRELQAHMRDTLRVQNPTEATALTNADQAWSRYVRMQEAAGRGPAAKNAEFSPSDLLNAVRSQAKGNRNRMFSEGDLPMQAFGRAGNDLIAGKQPNLQRILTDLTGAAAGGAVGHAVAGPWGAAAGAAAGAAGADVARTGVSRLRALPGARAVGEAVGRAAPVVGGVTDETHISPVGP